MRLMVPPQPRPRAALAFAVVDRELMLEQPELAVGALVIAQRRAAGRDRILEHVADPRHQRKRAFVGRPGARRDGGGAPLGRQPRAPQRLADVDVAEPRHHPLIGERRLEARLLGPTGVRQHGGVEGVAERLGPERAQQRLLLELGARHQLHRAEAARIVEGDPGAVRHVKDHMIVGGVLRLRMMIFAGHARAAVMGHANVMGDAERSRHAQMHQQHIAGGEIDQEIFGTAADPGDGLALQPCREVGRQRPAQIAPARLHGLEARALHDGLEAPPHRLDFRKLRHGMNDPFGPAHHKGETAGRHIELPGGARYGLV